MDSGVLRDFVIVITGGLLLVLLLLAGILGILFYLQIKALIKSVKETISATRELNAEAGEAIKYANTLIKFFKLNFAKKADQPAEGTKTKEK